MVASSGPFYTLPASATSDASNSTQTGFHAIALPKVSTNATSTQNDTHLVFLPVMGNTSHKFALSGNSLPKLGASVAKTPGNDGYCFHGCGLLTYHSTINSVAVMHNAKLLIVFWVGGGFSNCSTSHYFENSTNDPTATVPNDCSYMNLQVQFLNDICSDPFMNIAAQYTDGTGGAGPCFIATPPAGKFNPLVDTTAFPEIPLTDHDIQVEAQKMATYMGATSDGNTQVYVFMPYGTPSCSNSNSDCFGTTYCAYHGSIGTTFLYASMPDVSAVNNCGFVSTSPNSDPVADLESSPLSHELMESLTDPAGQGWYYLNGAHEIGDECAYDIGTTNTDGSNIHLGLQGDPYVIQKEWSNSNGGCTLSEQSLPASPSAPPTGISSSAISSSSIGLTWTASTGATSYNIFRSTSASGPFTTQVKTSVATSFNDTGLSPSTTYYYKITASNSGGTSAKSTPPASATTLAACTAPVSGDWIISSSCILSSTQTAPANVIIQPRAVLTVSNGILLHIDFVHFHLLVNSGGRVFIASGGTID
jgi:hypothetical protein